jgi:hypothetical protein
MHTTTPLSAGVPKARKKTVASNGQGSQQDEEMEGSEEEEEMPEVETAPSKPVATTSGKDEYIHRAKVRGSQAPICLLIPIVYSPEIDLQREEIPASA